MIRSWMSGWFVVGAGLGLAVAACGVEGANEMPLEPIDVTPPKIVSSTPAEGAVAASVLTTVAVTFDEPIDPATVDGAIALYSRFNPERVPGMVTYDESTLTLTFTPTLPLLHAERYALRLSTLTDLARNSFTIDGSVDGATISFNTKVNSPTARVDRNAAGQQVGATRYTLDVMGRPLDTRAYSSPGADNLWQTADDVVAGRFLTTWGPDGQLLDEVSYDPGPDTRLGTADDVPGGLTRHRWDAEVREVAFANLQGPGLDGAWQTDDDEVSTWYTIALQGDLPAQTVQHVGPGADGVWRTADDVADDVFTSTLGADGAQTRQVRSAAGFDSTAGTADDVIVEVRDSTSVGGLRTANMFRTRGPDTVWLTGDDGYNRWDKYTRDPRGLLIDVAECTGAGEDGQWGTPDDLVGFRRRFAYNAQGLLVLSGDFQGPGPDGIWATSDDVQARRQVFVRDAEGNVTASMDYVGPGIDGQWNTSDDRIGVETVFDAER